MPLKKFANLENNLHLKYANMIENYIYLHHTDQFIIIPTWPEQIVDSSKADFSQSTPMLRSAPIYSYKSSGPRGFQVSLKLHRELMEHVNYLKSNVTVEMGDDYVDTMVKQLQSMAYPRYADAEKMVDPPLVSLRLGDDLFIKGIVSGQVSVTYSLPIIRDRNGNDKYAVVDIGFSIEEVTPYNATQVASVGSFRGLDVTLERNLWKTSGTLSGNMLNGTTRVV